MKQMYKLGTFFCLIAVAAFIFNGCAFIFKGSNENMSFDGGQGSGSD